MPQPYIAEINPLAKEINESKEVSFQAPALGSNVSGYSGLKSPCSRLNPIVFASWKKQSQPKKTLKFPKKIQNFHEDFGNHHLSGDFRLWGYYLTTNIIKGKRRRRLQSYPRFRKQKSSFPRRKIPTPVAHVSLFNAPVIQEEEIISVLTLENINNALIAVANTTPANNLKEVVLRGENQTLINFSEFLPVLLTELKSGRNRRIFEIISQRWFFQISTDNGPAISPN